MFLSEKMSTRGLAGWLSMDTSVVLTKPVHPGHLLRRSNSSVTPAKRRSQNERRVLIDYDRHRIAESPVGGGRRTARFGQPRASKRKRDQIGRGRTEIFCNLQNDIAHIG